MCKCACFSTGCVVADADAIKWARATRNPHCAACPVAGLTWTDLHYSRGRHRGTWPSPVCVVLLFTATAIVCDALMQRLVWVMLHPPMTLVQDAMLNRRSKAREAEQLHALASTQRPAAMSMANRVHAAGGRIRRESMGMQLDGMEAVFGHTTDNG